MPSPRDLLRLVLTAALPLVALPAVASAQLRGVAAQEIDVGRESASLRLEFEDGDELSVSFSDSVRVNGEAVGAYDRGDALDNAWRSFLGAAVPLEGPALARHLREWTPPPSLPDSERAAAERVDQALETALAETGLADPVAGAEQGAADLDRAMRALVGRPRRLLELGRAVEDLDMERVRVYVGEDVDVAAGETVEGSLVVVDGDLEVAGEVDGSVVMVGGRLVMAEGGVVTGEVRLAGEARVVEEGGDIEGETVEVDPDRVDPDAIRAQIRDELRRELRDDLPRFDSPFRRMARALGELVGSLVGILVVAVLGGGLAVHFGREKLEVVAEAARQAPLRAGMVGLAGAFLTLPAWVLGALALVVTIVGILALPFWIVLFPLAVCLAAAVGYLAVAQSVGEWVARQRFERLDWVRVSNPYTTIVAGVIALSVWFVASNLVQMLGFLGFVSVLLAVCGGLVTGAAVLIGFGAVLLTRGGRQPAYVDPKAYWADPWEEDLGFGGSSRPRSAAPGPDADATASPEGEGPAA